MIARLRQGSSLVEDPEPEPRNDDMEVPPSSDRNQIGPENNLQTEEKMGRWYITSDYLTNIEIDIHIIINNLYFTI